ncbi:MAG: glycosyltransferase family 2 protein [Bacteroidales bacterium]|nr:glycosyltransferase family 2 protein [Bacteroidales bacterium]
MTLSVVIVNYNVKHFLEQCLISVFKSLNSIDSEVFVVDNASADGSCQMVRQRFPQVKLIENTVNYGFSYANNQAIRLAEGEFVLLLNPDTVVEEDTFAKCIAFMNEHKKAGSMAVKMIDGKGKFLPESKRAMPSPIVSFYKIFGLSRLFPKSKTFARYHLGHLSPNSTHEIEILSGAFMFIRKEALDKVGLLDESFFMYGEDIDLSYRILKGGYKNYYYPGTTIIHYKGESTKKGSINYVLVFYKAMMIFARKHFTSKNASLYIMLIYSAIYFRAGLSLVKRFVQRAIQPLMDALIMVAGFAAMMLIWDKLHFRGNWGYNYGLVYMMSLFYIVIWIVSSWLSGAYDKPQKLFASARGIGFGTLAILAIYALLPNSLRYSRAVILLVSVWSIVFVQLAHWSVGLYKKDVFTAFRKLKRVAIVGNMDEIERVHEILNNAKVDFNIVGYVSPLSTLTSEQQIATFNQLNEFVRINSIDEVIFCSSNISSQDIIKTMLTLVPLGIDYKIAPPDSSSVIGSNSIDTAGDLYTVDFSAISKPVNRRNKRLFDVLMCFFIILFSPILVLFVKRFGYVFSRAFGVLFGKFTWVGYAKAEGVDISGLPKLRQGVFPPLKTGDLKGVNPKIIERLNIQYAKNYNINSDMVVLYNQLF